MERLAVDMERVEFFLRDFEAGFVDRRGNRRLNREAGVGGGGNQIDNRRPTVPRVAALLFANKRKPPMCNFVPFPRPRGKMTDPEGHRQFGGQSLQFGLP